MYRQKERPRKKYILRAGLARLASPPQAPWRLRVGERLPHFDSRIAARDRILDIFIENLAIVMIHHHVGVRP